MPETSEIFNSNQGYNEVVSSIQKLQKSGEKHISVCWPTTSTALFMRRRINHEIGATFGVRHTTCLELNELVDELKDENGTFAKTYTTKELTNLVRISKTVFPEISPWRNISTIFETIRLAKKIPEKKLDYFYSNFSLAGKCYDLFKSISGELSSDNSINPELDVSHITGKCILVQAPELDDSTSYFISNFSDNIFQLIEPQYEDYTTTSKKLNLYHDPFEEIDAMFVEILNNGVDVGKDAIIVPNEHYRKFVISTAAKFSIPISGSSSRTLGDHEFIAFAREMIKLDNRASSDEIQNILNRNSWIKNSNNQLEKINKIKYCQKNIRKSETLGNYFEAITEFISNNLEESHFDNDEYDIPTARKSFSILKDLCTVNESASRYDAIYVLDLFTSMPLRNNKIGDGIYCATPHELFGCDFKSAWVLGMNDRYIPQRISKYSLIDKDQYPLLNIDDEQNNQQFAKSILNWLTCSASEVKISSSEIDISGKETALPHWVSAESKIVPKIKFDTSTQNMKFDKDFLVGMFDNEPSPKNILVNRKPPRQISATSIEKLALCPFKYFHYEELKLKSKADSYNPDLLSNIDAGNFVHTLLEDFTTQCQSKDELFRALDIELEEFFENGILPNKASINKNKSRLVKILNNFLELDRENDLIKSKAEVKVEKDLKIGDSTITIKGKIDRLDISENSITTIIDYKTGKNEEKSNLNFYRFGRRLQLAVYALLLFEQQSSGKIEYWYIGDKPEKATKDIDNRELEIIQNLLEDILSILFTKYLPGKPVYTKQLKSSTSDEEQCEKCEFDDICYSQYKDFWQEVSATAELARYTNATTAKGKEDE